MTRTGAVRPLDEPSDAAVARARPRPSSRSGPSPAWVWAFDLILLISGIIIVHLASSGPIPSGGDGGNWLALARESLGEQVMSADVAYEPVFIGLLASLLGLFGPIDALLVSALITEAVLVGAVYFVTRRAGRIPALTSAVLVGMAGYRLEAYAWGAYPQILALGVGLVTIWAVARYVTLGGWGRLAIVVVGGLVVLSSHKLVGGLMLTAVPVTALHTMWLAGWRRTLWKRSALVVGSVWAVGAAFVATWLAQSADGVEPTLNALGLSRAEQVRFAFQEATVPWLLVGVIAVVGMGIRSWRENSAPTISLGFGWVAASVAGFLVLGEPRTLIQAQVAVIPVAVLVVWRWWVVRRGVSGPRTAGVIGLGILVAALLGSLVLTGLHRYDRAADWYRVVGQLELEALTSLKEVAEPGDLVIASKGPNGNPIGWWVEGYVGIPTYTHIDTAFLAFPDERAQADAADAVFSAPPEEAASMLDDLGARFLILDRRGPDVGWLAGGDPFGLTSLSDGTLLILEVSDGS